MCRVGMWIWHFHRPERSERMNPIDYDGAWKETLEVYFRPFLAFCFPVVERGIDWTIDPLFLDKELQEVVRDAETGCLRVDKLVKVQTVDGAEEWLLVHVEVQSQADGDLARRMYRYHHRLEDRYGRPVVSLAVLGDGDPGWRSGVFRQGKWGCWSHFRFPTCKLLDLPAMHGALELLDNPVAIVIAAHLAAQSTYGDMAARHEYKWRFVRGLYERGFGKRDVLEVYRLLDWLLVLPEENEVAFKKTVVEYEMKNNMEHITTIERLGRQEGRQEGWQNSVLELLEARFGEAPEAIRAQVREVVAPAELRAMLLKAAVVRSLAEFSNPSTCRG